MGKSPGKWIKGILFGRKASKSSLSTGLSRSASEKPARVSSQESTPISIADTPLNSDPVPDTVSDRVDNSSFGKGDAAILASEGQVSSLSEKDVDTISDTGLLKGSEKITLEQAAIIVQASFRGYQARHGLQTLKGAIMLQAAIRGRLVRRQAVATLFCMQGIVRFQAITRGYMTRIGNGQCRKQSPVVKDASNQDSCEIKYNPANTLLKNAFINELLASSQTIMPLHLQCGPGDSNSAWSWLHRWSASQVWVPNFKQKEISQSKIQTVEREHIKPKRNGRRVPSTIVRNDPNHANAETEKLKLIDRKFSSQALKSALEHPQFGNSNVKHGLKKNQKPIGDVSNEDISLKKPKRHQRKLLKSPSPKFSERESNTPIGKSKEDLVEPGTNSVASQLSRHLSPEEHQNLFCNKNQVILPVEKDFKDDEISSDDYKSSQTASLPAKLDDQDVTPGSVTRAPSYMATTASSKAKVKSQGSPRFVQDAIKENGLTRRYSLPSSMNGKLISSPRVHRLVQSNGKEGIKIDRSLSSSREISDKVNHVDWKW